MHYTYILKNKNNGKYYYGASSSIHRKRTHLTKLKMGKHHNAEMQADYDAGHEFEFIVTGEFESRKAAFAAELQTIVDNLDNPMCYNKSLLGYKQSDEHIRKRFKDRAPQVLSEHLQKVFEEANAARRKRISINGVIYPSILGASIALKLCRRMIKRRLASTAPEFKDWLYIK